MLHKKLCNKKAKTSDIVCTKFKREYINNQDKNVNDIDVLKSSMKIIKSNCCQKNLHKNEEEKEEVLSTTKSIISSSKTSQEFSSSDIKQFSKPSSSDRQDFFLDPPSPLTSDEDKKEETNFVDQNLELSNGIFNIYTYIIVILIIFFSRFFWIKIMFFFISKNACAFSVKN